MCEVHSSTDFYRGDMPAKILILYNNTDERERESNEPKTILLTDAGV